MINAALTTSLYILCGYTLYILCGYTLYTLGGYTPTMTWNPPKSDQL